MRKLETSNTIKNLLTEILAKNFPNTDKEFDIEINEACRTSNRHDQNKSTPRHIIIKFPKIQHRTKILRAATEKKQITYKPIRLIPDFST